MKRGSQDVVGEKCVLNDNDKLSFDTNAKNVAWKEFYDQLLNQEFDWDQSSYLLHIQLLVLLFM